MSRREQAITVAIGVSTSAGAKTRLRREITDFSSHAMLLIVQSAVPSMSDLQLFTVFHKSVYKT